jgi:hypothetical protein
MPNADSVSPGLDGGQVGSWRTSITAADSLLAHPQFGIGFKGEL